MILIDCHHCRQRHLVSNGDIRSLTTIDGAVLGEVHCAVSRAIVVHDFTNDLTIDPSEQLAFRVLAGNTAA